MATKITDGTNGRDVFYGDDADDIMHGFGGNDALLGYGGNNQLFGGDGDDSLLGYAGNDLLDGGAGNDTLESAGGNDTFLGGDGNDQITLSGSVYTGDWQTVDAGDGNDLVQLYGARFQTADALKGGAGLDTLKINSALFHTFSAASAGFEQLDGYVLGYVQGTADGDHIDFGGLTLVNGTAGLQINGFDGNDVLSGSEGADNLNGGTGDDSLAGNGGSDTLYGEGGNDSIDGGAADDHLYGNAGNDIVHGGAGNDTITGGAGNDILTGGTGADTFVFSAAAGNGFDTIRDFVHGVDALVFAHADYGFGAGHGLTAAEFTVGDTAVGASGQFIWNDVTHVLSFDHDGAGGDAAIAIAGFTGAVTLTADDLHFS